MTRSEALHAGGDVGAGVTAHAVARGLSQWALKGAERELYGRSLFPWDAQGCWFRSVQVNMMNARQVILVVL